MNTRNGDGEWTVEVGIALDGAAGAPRSLMSRSVVGLGAHGERAEHIGRGGGRGGGVGVERPDATGCSFAQNGGENVLLRDRVLLRLHNGAGQTGSGSRVGEALLPWARMAAPAWAASAGPAATAPFSQVILEALAGNLGDGISGCCRRNQKKKP